MRKALDRVRDSALAHDLAETAAMTGAQTLINAANGMTPEDAAEAAALGFTVGSIARPISGRLGRRVGLLADKHMDYSKHADGYDKVMMMLPGSAANNQFNKIVSESDQVPGALRKIHQLARPLIEARHNAVYKGPNGQMMSGYEGDFSFLGRFFGDNLFHAALMLAPGIVEG